MPTLPEWICHKRVRAAKIVNIARTEGGQVTTLHFEGGDWLYVNALFIVRHKPEVGGYFVEYEDGYQSFSPAKAFESGYTRADLAASTRPALNFDDSTPVASH